MSQRRHYRRRASSEGDEEEERSPAHKKSDEEGEIEDVMLAFLNTTRQSVLILDIDITNYFQQEEIGRSKGDAEV